MPDVVVSVGDTSVATAVKRFGSLFGSLSYAAGLGMIREEYDATDRATTLRYARIGGVEYGEPNPLLPPVDGDPTPPGDYAPLGLGDRWEYATAELVEPDKFRRVEVVGDTTVGGLPYVVVRTQSFGGDGSPRWTVTDQARFDAAGATVVGDDGESLAFLFGFGPAGVGGPSCRLDLPFADPGESSQCSGFNGEPPTGTGGSDVFVPLLGAETAVKRLDAGLGFAWTFAAGLGMTEAERDVFEPYVLRYARVNGVEYGTPIASLPPYVADEAEPSASALALTAAPNPTSGPLAVTLTMPAPAAVVVEAFDALGRRVHRAEVALGAGPQTLDVDAGRWAPGVYVVRATAGGEAATARVVRR